MGDRLHETKCSVYLSLWRALSRRVRRLCLAKCSGFSGSRRLTSALAVSAISISYGFALTAYIFCIVFSLFRISHISFCVRVRFHRACALVSSLYCVSVCICILYVFAVCMFRSLFLCVGSAWCGVPTCRISIPSAMCVGMLSYVLRLASIAQCDTAIVYVVERSEAGLA